MNALLDGAGLRVISQFQKIAPIPLCSSSFDSVLVILVMTGLLCSLAACEKQQPIPLSIGQLAVGESTRQTIASGATQRLTVSIEAGWYLRAVVAQEGVDVSVTLIDAAGHELMTIDSPNGAHGPEIIDHIPETGDELHFDIATWPGSPAGTYQARIEAIRQPSESDRVRVAALATFCRGNTRRRQKDSESLQQALTLFAEAAKQWQGVGAFYQQASVLEVMAKVYHRLGETEAAAVRYRQAIEIVSELGDAWRQADLLCSYGIMLRWSGRPGEALDCYRQALVLARSVDYRAGEATALNNTGVICRERGQLYRALDLYQQALAIHQEVGELSNTADAHQNIGAVFLWMSRLADALDAFNRALEIRRELGDTNGEAAALTEIGWIQYRQGNSQQAIVLYQQALDLRRREVNPVGEAVTLDRLGSAYRDLAQHEPSLAAYERALSTFEQARLPVYQGHTANNIGELYRRRQDDEQALGWGRRALALFREHGEAHGAAEALFMIAKCNARQGRLQNARTDFEEAINIVEEIRRKTRAPGLQSSYSAGYHQLYDLYLELLMSLHDLDPEGGFDQEAFAAAERYRARSLLESLVSHQARPSDQTRQDLEQRLHAVQEELSTKELERVKLAAAGVSDQELVAAEAEIRRLLIQLDIVSAQLHQSDAAGSPPMTVQRIRQEILDQDTLLLYFALAEERSFLWLIGQDTLASFSLPSRQEIETIARQVYSQLATRNQRRVRIQGRLDSARLSRMLLAPVADRLGSKRLLVVGEGVLQMLPFAALPVPGEHQSSERLLIHDHEIVQLPSVAVLAAVRQTLAHRTPAVKQLAVFADPVTSGKDPRLPVAGSQSPLHYARLGHSEREAEVIEAMIPPEHVLSFHGFAATRTAAVDPALSQYRMLHFATHGLLHPQHPELSGLVLSLFDDTGQACNGFIRAHEIAHLDLPAELVVLSACETAKGVEIEGEGIVNLTRACMQAGAARVVVSLWKVNDRATAELMERFYRAMLADGLAPSAALRAAQLSMLDDPRLQAPFYWAGFIFQGEWRPLPPLPARSG